MGKGYHFHSRHLDALIGIDPSDEYNRTLQAMTRYQEGLYDEALSDIRVLIGEERTPPTMPSFELERRLLQGILPNFNRQRCSS